MPSFVHPSILIRLARRSMHDECSALLLHCSSVVLKCVECRGGVVAAAAGGLFRLGKVR